MVMIDLLLKDGNISQECNCAIRKFQDEYTWDEWQKSVENDSIDEKIDYNIYNMTYDQIKKIDCGSKINYEFLDQV